MLYCPALTNQIPLSRFKTNMFLPTIRLCLIYVICETGFQDAVDRQTMTRDQTFDHKLMLCRVGAWRTNHLKNLNPQNYYQFHARLETT